MSYNEVLDFIMNEYKLPNNLISKLTGISESAISLYRRSLRNIGKKSFIKVYKELEKFKYVDRSLLEELKEKYEKQRI